MPQESFTVTEHHQKLIKEMWVDWNTEEYGAPTIDPKRPYGNSDVERDILEILELTYSIDRDGDPVWTEDQHELAASLHKQMKTALQILTSTLQLTPGTYTKEKYTNAWTKDE